MTEGGRGGGRDKLTDQPAGTSKFTTFMVKNQSEAATPTAVRDVKRTSLNKRYICDDPQVKKMEVCRRWPLRNNVSQVKPS